MEIVDLINKTITYLVVFVYILQLNVGTGHNGLLFICFFLDCGLSGFFPPLDRFAGCLPSLIICNNGSQHSSQNDADVVQMGS
jgi:hypothetical protein